MKVEEHLSKTDNSLGGFDPLILLFDAEVC